jgi:hypothetical protein
MALTSNCEIFGSINEAGINLAVRHIMRKRPSLFNYGTAFFVGRENQMCAKIEPHPWVIQRRNPLFTVEDPLPLLGTDGTYGLNFCAQLTKAEIDFHPGNVFPLPPELGTLPEQHFAFHVQVCAGIGCPSRRFLQNIPVPEQRDSGNTKPPDKENRPTDKKPEPKLPPVAIPFNELQCFCLDLYAACHFEINGPVGDQKLVGKLDGLEIVDIKPGGLENSIECYLTTLIHLVILPRLSIALERFTINIPLDITNASVTVSATPISGAVPHNPAVEKDQLKIFIDVEVA